MVHLLFVVIIFLFAPFVYAGDCHDDDLAHVGTSNVSYNIVQDWYLVDGCKWFISVIGHIYETRLNDGADFDLTKMNVSDQYADGDWNIDLTPLPEFEWATRNENGDKNPGKYIGPPVHNAADIKSEYIIPNIELEVGVVPNSLQDLSKPSPENSLVEAHGE